MFPSSATLLSFYAATSYVAALYVFPGRRIYGHASRNDPKAIWYGMKAVGCGVLANLLIIPWLQSRLASDGFSFVDCFFRLGLVPGAYAHFRGLHWDTLAYATDILRALSILGSLYAADLLDSAAYYLLVPDTSPVVDLVDRLSCTTGLRNYVFGPITEELVYTSMVLQNYRLLQPTISRAMLLLATPMFFGVAHVHHARQLLATGHRPAQVALTSSFQILYTTLFGTFTNYIYYHTAGNLWACILLHAVCNYLSFPSLSSDVFADYCAKVPPALRALWKMRLLHAWGYTYRLCLLCGLLAFLDGIRTFSSSAGDLFLDA
ncbi:AAL186Wp [Eremothecium gossypii ATCC 10895]|uniref:intramembrane prenyl-peptidase Rce1 n=1 Tax=Eremothecium gossypii (strain ATCC 10895 / CBS 109.51 / FGSC 9923 / NRRL Y-1056) TaxID=284811 RepID=Q75FB7_EREGS|nr:AAL186Wp [Eremothecium gossypii ATCC 10895]AAS50180.1 AAL186Wp [Eremothecium gossypii ATCC 10895]AEY94465.1 FAAL186Wp [Eremothecium gossypii FDAG1]